MKNYMLDVQMKHDKRRGVHGGWVVCDEASIHNTKNRSPNLLQKNCSQFYQPIVTTSNDRMQRRSIDKFLD